MSALAEGVAAFGRILGAVVPGLGSATEAVSGQSTRDGSRLSGGERVGSAAAAAGEVALSIGFVPGRIAGYNHRGTYHGLMQAILA